MLFKNEENIKNISICVYNKYSEYKILPPFLKHSIQSIDLSKFDAANETDMTATFYECTSLTSLDLSNFDTSGAKDMRETFYGCESLTSLDLSNFDTSGVKQMSSMFYGCKSLTSLDLSTFNTTNLDNMSYMFKDCNSLESLDLSNFNMTKVADMYTHNMFVGCDKLKTIIMKNCDQATIDKINAVKPEQAVIVI